MAIQLISEGWKGIPFSGNSYMSACNGLLGSRRAGTITHGSRVLAITPAVTLASLLTECAHSEHTAQGM
jgi:hypothetical protein